jgi:hypothetical protein
MGKNSIKLFHLKETNDIIVLDETTKWWDTFHMTRFADYIKRKFKHGLTKINMN